MQKGKMATAMARKSTKASTRASRGSGHAAVQASSVGAGSKRKGRVMSIHGNRALAKSTVQKVGKRAGGKINYKRDSIHKLKNGSNPRKLVQKVGARRK